MQPVPSGCHCRRHLQLTKAPVCSQGQQSLMVDRLGGGPHVTSCTGTQRQPVNQPCTAVKSAPGRTLAWSASPAALQPLAAELRRPRPQHPWHRPRSRSPATERSSETAGRSAGLQARLTQLCLQRAAERRAERLHAGAAKSSSAAAKPPQRLGERSTPWRCFVGQLGGLRGCFATAAPDVLQGATHEGLQKNADQKGGGRQVMNVTTLHQVHQTQSRCQNAPASGAGGAASSSRSVYSSIAAGRQCRSFARFTGLSGSKCVLSVHM